MHTLAQLKSGALKGSVSLKLSENLCAFPAEILELADTLERLDLSQNELKELPADFGKLKKLKIFFCSDNNFTELPEVLGDCPLLDIVGFKSNKIETIPARALNTNLRWLILTNNCITTLPAKIGLCHNMQKLALAGNKLQELPQALSSCHNLSLLRISANELKELPYWLLEMPRLAWLAFSGNRFNIAPTVAILPFVDWQELILQHVLGEGASGIIYKAIKYGAEAEKNVAVKIFKGAVTSDGLPDDEMNTFIAAGHHQGMVQLTGQLAGQPEGKKGLIMELIPDSYYNLGMPPSLQSCTRDVFAADMQLPLYQILRITSTIASVANQLHAKGILHGDLYAHNTLIDNNGNTLFGDFGAACFYDKTNIKVAASLERIEVCAFGHLIDDLIGLCNEKLHPALKQLEALRDLCSSPDVLLRPDFKSIHTALLII